MRHRCQRRRQTDSTARVHHTEARKHSNATGRSHDHDPATGRSHDPATGRLHDPWTEESSFYNHSKLPLKIIKSLSGDFLENVGPLVNIQNMVKVSSNQKN